MWFVTALMWFLLVVFWTLGCGMALTAILFLMGVWFKCRTDRELALLFGFMSLLSALLSLGCVCAALAMGRNLV